MAPKCFGLQPSSGSLQLSLAKVILILTHSVRLCRNLLCGGVAACPSMVCVLCAVLCTAHSTFHPNLHTRPSPTQCDIYQMLYWYNLFSWWWSCRRSKHV